MNSRHDPFARRDFLTAPSPRICSDTQVYSTPSPSGSNVDARCHRVASVSACLFPLSKDFFRIGDLFLSLALATLCPNKKEGVANVSVAGEIFQG